MMELQKYQLYQVEAILAKRNIKGRVSYLVKWKGYPEAQSTWQGIRNLKTVKSMIQDYESLNLDETQITIASLQKNEALNKLQMDPQYHLSLENSIILDNISMKIKSSQFSNQSSTHCKIQTEGYSSNLGKVKIESYQQFNLQKQVRNNLNATKNVNRNLIPNKKSKKCNQVEYSLRKNQEFGDFHNKNLSTINLSHQQSLQITKIGQYNSKYQPKIDNYQPRKNFRNIIQKKPPELNSGIQIGKKSLRSNKKIEATLNNLKNIRQVQGSDSNLNEYLIQYQDGSLKIFNTFDLVVTFPFEFILYLEGKIKDKKQLQKT